MLEEIPAGFIDIHSHILPGLDDGPVSMEECLAMAERYQALGVRCVVATPHWYQATGWAATPQQIARSAAEAERAITKSGLSLRILPGMEIGGTDRLSPSKLATEVLTLGPSGYYLAELPLATAIADPEQYLLPLEDGDRRLRVVLAHPERCATFVDSDVPLRSLTARGVLVQVNIGSLLGDFGPQVQRTALNLLTGGLVHLLATDAHASGKRLPPDPRDWQRLSEYIGPQALAAACDDNPRRLLSGKTVVPVQVDGERLDKFFPGYHTQKDNKISTLARSNSLADRLRRLFLH